MRTRIRFTAHDRGCTRYVVNVAWPWCCWQRSINICSAIESSA